MYRMSLLFVVSLLVFTTSAQTINLKGKVSNSNGRPISGAIVVLAGRNLKDTTDAQGAYSIISGTSQAIPVTILPGTGSISLNNGIVSFSLTKTEPVSIKVFDMKGNLLERLLDRPVPAGIYRYNLSACRLAVNVMVIRISIGPHTSTFRSLPLNNGARVNAVSVGGAPKGGGLARLQAVVDSLKVTASGYMSSARAIESYQGEVNITLDSIKLEKFSFFVTSLIGLQRLSGSENGFGGDLRFGKTGQGAGLLGADSICQCLAESSMPGSKVKQWRAFLSVAKGPDGRQVNAIDRIGTGPWYDRVGRLVSNSISDLLNDRPDADPEIKNDLPNEDGIPNHQPDPAKPAVDNHQMITGSGIDGKLRSSDTRNVSTTCQDWTSASADAGKPSCGLSWPRTGGGGGGFGGATSDETMPMGGGGGGSRGNWIYVWELFGCEAGIDLAESSGRGTQGITTIGNGGGYGGFYCFALNP